MSEATPPCAAVRACRAWLAPLACARRGEALVEFPKIHLQNAQQAHEGPGGAEGHLGPHAEIAGLETRPEPRLEVIRPRRVEQRAEVLRPHDKAPPRQRAVARQRLPAPQPGNKAQRGALRAFALEELHGLVHQEGDRAAHGVGPLPIGLHGPGRAVLARI